MLDASIYQKVFAGASTREAADTYHLSEQAVEKIVATVDGYLRDSFDERRIRALMAS